MKHYLTADEHYDHEKIISYEHRPFATVEEMNRVLWSNYTRLVRPEDCCIHVGDLSWNKKLFLDGQEWNGYDVFLRGSHDNPARYKITSLTLRYKGHNIQVVHNPDDVDLMAPGLAFVGHVHRAWLWKFLTPDVLAINVGVDVHRYAPVELNALMGIAKTANKMRVVKHQTEG